MLLLSELKSGNMMGRLYVESLTQVLVIHLLRHYSAVARIITSENRSLTRVQLRQAIDYIQTHLNQDLSLAELASVIRISPTYFASLSRVCCKNRKRLTINTLSGIDSCSAPRKSGKIRQNPCTRIGENVPKSCLKPHLTRKL